MSTPQPPAQQHDGDPDHRMPTSLKVFLAVLAALVAGFVVLHLLGGGFRHHGH